MIVGGVSAAVSKTAAAPIERVKLLIQNQVSGNFDPIPELCHKTSITHWGLERYILYLRLSAIRRGDFLWSFVALELPAA